MSRTDLKASIASSVAHSSDARNAVRISRCIHGFGMNVFGPVSAFAQQPSQYGNADEAKAMLVKAVAAVKSDKIKALDMFAKGEGGFLTWNGAS
jgi:hypothetical protein